MVVSEFSEKEKRRAQKIEINKIHLNLWEIIENKIKFRETLEGKDFAHLREKEKKERKDKMGEINYLLNIEILLRKNGCHMEKCERND